MAYVAESQVYTEGIYQLETTDPVIGGTSGIANQQAKDLANRTAYLKKQVDDIAAGNKVVVLKGGAGSVVDNTYSEGADQNTNLLANTSWVQSVINARLTGRNKLINGDFIISQRGSSFSSPGNGDLFTMDRWKVIVSGSRSVTISTDTSMRAGVIDARKNATITLNAASGTFELAQAIEGVTTLEDGKATLSFYVHSSIAQTLSVQLSQHINKTTMYTDTAYWVEAKTVALSANTYTKVVLTWTIPQIGNLGLTLDEDNCLIVKIKVTNTAAHTLKLTNVQLEKGIFSTQFEQLERHKVEDQCMRYYEKLDYQANNTDIVHYATSGGSETLMSLTYSYKARKRKVPVVTIQSGTYAGTAAFTGVDAVRVTRSGTVAIYAHTIIDAEY